jgi:hypothetical protein
MPCSIFTDMGVRKHNIPAQPNVFARVVESGHFSILSFYIEEAGPPNKFNYGRWATSGSQEHFYQK